MISVVVPTRNRPAHALPCARAILANTGVGELIVVDQSDGTATRDELATVTDPRLRYVHSDERGCSNGRNLGVEMARNDLVAFTDDDCRVARDWAQRIEEVFARDPAAAVVCGSVRVPQELVQQGSASSFEPSASVWRGSFGDWGLTANLVVRRQVLDRVGRFDPMLGVGGPLRSGGEPDLLFRVFRAGLEVVNAPEVAVEHLGVRAPGDDSRALWRSYGLGTGAAIFKHVRLGDPLGLWLCLRWLGACGAWVLRGLWQSGRPTGLGYSVAFVAGCVRSFRFRIDRRTRMYAARR